MNIEDIVEEAGDMTQPPKQKAPRKWFPELLAIPIKLLVLPFLLLDSMAQRIARIFIRPPYKKGGKCKKRGNCCYYIMIRKSWGIFGWLDLFWHTQINGFFKRSNKIYKVNGRSFCLMGCRYLKKDGRCGNYLLRPAICRTWPRIEIFGRPETLKGCGYYAVPRKKSSKSRLPILD